MNENWIQTDFKAVDKRDEVRSVQGWLLGETKTRPIITDGKRAFGIPNGRAFMGRRIQDRAKVEQYTLPTPLLSQDASHMDAMKAIRDTLAPYLPVGDDKHVHGFVTALDLCAFLEDGPTPQDAAVRVPLLTEEDTLDRAMQLFRDVVVDQLPVVDTHGKLVGVLPRSTVVRVEHERMQGMGKTDFQSERNRLLRDPVKGFAEPGWNEVSASAPFRDVIAALRKTEYAIVPDIVDPATGQRSIGVITPAYLARACAKENGPGWAFGRHGEGELTQKHPTRPADTPVRPKQMSSRHG